MAKTNMIMREAKRAKLVAKLGKKREALKAIVSSTTATYEEKQEAAVALQKMPRDSSYTRQRNRCKLTGRTRGVYSKFGLARHKLREAAMRGEVPGLKKASW
jgi:small subunit ribosomal protein S14